MSIPKKLKNKLKERTENNSFRTLKTPSGLVDFASNDYMGFSSSERIFNKTHQYLIDHDLLKNGSGGSRLLTGNSSLHEQVEKEIAHFHNAEAALIFNSGYDANLGLLSSIPQRNDIILYDELSHASIRDGIKMSNAKAFKFKHNDLEDLENLLKKNSDENEIYIVTESVFSMDGDTPDLNSLVELSKKNNAHLIIDEAHALGVFGNKGEGLIQHLGLEDEVFARLATFGKALGAHGAAVLGCDELRDYLVNFARSFIYTTALPPHSLANLHVAYSELASANSREKLMANIHHFKSKCDFLCLNEKFIKSHSAIQSILIPGNRNVKECSDYLISKGYDVRPILSPTVPQGTERLRFCIHSFNSNEEIDEVLNLVATFVGDE